MTVTFDELTRKLSSPPPDYSPSAIVDGCLWFLHPYAPPMTMPLSNAPLLLSRQLVTNPVGMLNYMTREDAEQATLYNPAAWVNEGATKSSCGIVADFVQYRDLYRYLQARELWDAERKGFSLTVRSLDLFGAGYVPATYNQFEADENNFFELQGAGKRTLEYVFGLPTEILSRDACSAWRSKTRVEYNAVHQGQSSTWLAVDLDFTQWEAVEWAREVCSANPAALLTCGSLRLPILRPGYLKSTQIPTLLVDGRLRTHAHILSLRQCCSCGDQFVPMAATPIGGLCRECMSAGQFYSLEIGGLSNLYKPPAAQGCILPNTDKPDPYFLMGAGETFSEAVPFYGVELELKTVTNLAACQWFLEPHKAARLLTRSNIMYCKRDGSIPGGFEAVTHPFTVQWLKEHPQTFDKLLSLKDVGYRSYATDCCGMHVHISKAAFSSLHLYKFLKLIYEEPGFVMEVSQRRLSQLQQWSALDTDKEGRDPNQIIYRAKTKGNGTLTKYAAVNLIPSSTVELRVFRGNLDRLAFFKNLEFSFAAVDFTRDSSVFDVRRQVFLDFVAGNCKEYPSLYKWLVERGFYNTPRNRLASNF